MNDKSRFDKFTDEARTALSLAQEEAQCFRHDSTGTEHLLQELIREGEGVASLALSCFNLAERAKRCFALSARLKHTTFRKLLTRSRLNTSS